MSGKPAGAGSEQDGAASAAQLAEYLTRPMTPAPAATLAALEAGPISPSDALPLAQKNRLLDPTPLTIENGWCTTAEGIGHVAVRVPMPGVSAEMVDWWFDWHPRDSVRYRIWYPAAHFANRVVPSPVAREKATWGSVHYPYEDVGGGPQHIRIAFKAPTELGFATDAVADPQVGTIVCGLGGDPVRRVQATVMAHVWLREDDGLVLRSRFWLGAVIRPDLPGVLGDLAGRLLNRRALRERVIPRSCAARARAPLRDRIHAPRRNPAGASRALRRSRLRHAARGGRVLRARLRGDTLSKRSARLVTMRA